MMQLDKASLQAYLQRWAMVSQVQATERRNATIEARWRQLNSLVRMAAALGLRSENDDEQNAAVAERWNRLRAIYLNAQRDAP